MSNNKTFYSNVIVSQNLESDLQSIIKEFPENKRFLVTETNTTNFCLPLLKQMSFFSTLQHCEVPAGEENKKLSSVEMIWQFLSENGADRKSLVINLGGGMLTDMGSFAASTYKRGMKFVNIPTTLLSQVDASVGGKTGFNFNGFKNEIGVINQPDVVIIDAQFLQTIDQANVVSGYAEMVKHGMIYSVDHLKDVEAFDLSAIDYSRLTELIGNSVAIKDYFVNEDPNEFGIRKALNFGHTIGHAFESHAMKKGNPILHGHAVAYGIIAELYLSYKVSGLSEESMIHYANWIKSVFGVHLIEASEYDVLYQLMTHDKKNEGARINFTLLPEIGKVEINKDCGKELIVESLDFFRKTMSN